MNWKRTILDALAMEAYLNLFAALIVVINPRIMMCSYPQSIRKAASTPQTRRERKLCHLWMYSGFAGSGRAWDAFGFTCFEEGRI